MGLMDNIRGFFSGSKNDQPAQPQVNVDYEKSRLANRILDLVSKIKRINSFDNSLWNLSNVSIYDLQRKSLDELQKLNFALEKRLIELNKKNQTQGPDDTLEASKWTGEKPNDMSARDFDRFQRNDDR